MANTTYAKNQIKNKISQEIKISLVGSFGIVKKLLGYFPTRFLILSFLFCYLFLYNNAIFFKTLESQFMTVSLSFFHIPSMTQAGHFFIRGTSVTLPIDVQILFLVFFPSLAFSAKTSISIRLKILGCGILCFLALIVLQFVLIIVLLFMRIPDWTNLVQHEGVLLSVFASSLIIEFTFFITIILPKSTKVTPVIKRNYITEWLFYGAVVSITVLVFEFVFRFLQVSINSVVGVFTSLEIMNMLNFSNYIAFVLAEIKTPTWVNLTRHLKSPFRPNITFLLAAYNEEEFIERTISSIDKTAEEYSGKTSIFIVNDGSTDNTEKIVAQSMSNLKHCTGTFITIPNSGKGTALNIGLESIKDDLIFRIDADSVVEKRTISYMVRHFIDPEVASVGGMILSLDERSIWQKLFNISDIVWSSFKKNGDMSDSITIQSGAFSVFRKEALIRAGGWAIDQNGEDGEITVRLGRMGYKIEYDGDGAVLSDVPGTVKEVRKQRMRWAVAFYHSRSRNLDILKDTGGPRTIAFLLNLVGHAIGFVGIIFWPFLLASIFTGSIGNIGVIFFSSPTPNHNVTSVVTYKTIEYLIRIPVALIVVQLIIWASHYTYSAYILNAYHKLYHFKYVPFLRLYWFIAGTIPKMETTAILLSWSSKWKTYDKESYKHFLKELKKGIDTYSS